MKKPTTNLLAFLTLLLLGSTLVHAQPTGTGNPPTGVDNPPERSSINVTFDNPFRTGDNLFDLLVAIINDILLPIGGILAVLAFIWSGFMYVTAQGNDTKLKNAHKALLYTAIGTALLLGSWVIANVIKTTVEQLQ